MIMQWPQIAWIVCSSLVIGLVAAQNGQPVVGTYSAKGISIIILLNVILLYYGGFFG
jgi:hypothetical protein